MGLNGLKNSKGNGTIHVQFDNPFAGIKLKDNRLHDHLKKCVPIWANSQTFQCCNITVTKQ